MKIKNIRALVALAVFVVVGVGLAVHTGTGTLSSMGWEWVASVCPLGALEMLFGSWSWVPRLVIALVAVALICFMVGKAFCSWACPIPYIKNLFKTKKQKALEEATQKAAADKALERYENGDPAPTKSVELDGRHVVLGASLLSASIFGFPVFCLICPIGLSIGEFVLLWRLVQYNEMTWALLLFPVIIILEVVIFKKWCGSICPIGGLLSLFGAANRTFRPVVDKKVCLREAKGAPCKVCDNVCPELVDPHSNLGERPMSECVRCGNCMDACPVRAISFPFLKKKDKEDAPAEPEAVVVSESKTASE